MTNFFEKYQGYILAGVAQVGKLLAISGVYWHTLYSEDKASSHLGSDGYNRLFFGASSGNITGVATLLSWSIS